MSGRHRDKVKASVADALADLRDGARIMVGGFGLCGNPEALIAGVVARGVKDLTLISNNAGNLGKGLATWLEAGLVRKVILSYLGTNETLHRAIAAGLRAFELTGSPIAIVDIPLLYETAGERRFDRVVATLCSPATQLARLLARGLSETAARQRLEAQIPAEEKASRADFVVDTDGTFADTDSQVDAIWSQLNTFVAGS